MLLDNLKILNLTNKGRVECTINGKIIFIEFDTKYLPYVSENYDGFLLVILPIAMKNKKDITINGSISYKLYHNLCSYVMKMMSIMFSECEQININVKSFDFNKQYENNYVGCGLSCGVDSLCCLEDYYYTKCKNYKLTHVTNFHTGGSNNLLQYQKRLDNVKKYLQNTDLELLDVVSNFIEINNYEHRKIHVLRNLAVPLFFQKLFSKYYYSSGYSYIDSKIVKNISEITYSDPMLIHLLSTENLEYISHGCQYTRPEKILKISNNKLSYEYLDVCINGKYVEKNDKLNCSICNKCMRTLIILDYYNKIDNYNKIFDLNKYYKRKKKYIKKLNKEKSLDREIIELINKN